MVVTDHGIAATSHFLASQAGAQILSQGGTAIDAAIAANAALGVTEPMMNGIGGDLFLLYWDAKSGKLYGLNASGWAPEGLTVDFLKNRGLTSMPDAGIYSVTVPGAVDGWAMAHQRVVLRKDYSAMMGRGQAVLHNSATGTNFAASDPRADGSAEPEPTPTK
jgi:gamma-glutamyltranspeptidase/glutathione hydrolase